VRLILGSLRGGGETVCDDSKELALDTEDALDDADDADDIDDEDDAGDGLASPTILESILGEICGGT
jgi:hypothetical protein